MMRSIVKYNYFRVDCPLPNRNPNEMLLVDVLRCTGLQDDNQQQRNEHRTPNFLLKINESVIDRSSNSNYLWQGGLNFKREHSRYFEVRFTPTRIQLQGDASGEPNGM